MILLTHACRGRLPNLTLLQVALEVGVVLVRKVLQDGIGLDGGARPLLLRGQREGHVLVQVAFQGGRPNNEPLLQQLLRLQCAVCV